MNRGALRLTVWRKQHGNYEILADFLGVNPTRVFRILKGKIIPTSSEIELLSQITGFNADQLRKDFYTALQLEEELSDINLPIDVEGTNEFIKLLEKLRRLGALIDVSTSAAKQIDRIEELRRHPVRTPIEIMILEQMLAKLLIIETVTHTLTLDTRDLLSQVSSRNSISKLNKFSQHLDGADQYFIDTNLILRALIAYREGKYGKAFEIFNNNFHKLESSYVKGLVLRDQIVIAGRLGDLTLYNRLQKDVDQTINSKTMNLIDLARIHEGLARAALKFFPSEATDLIQRAKALLRSALSQNLHYQSVHIQVLRTELEIDLQLHLDHGLEMIMNKIQVLKEYIDQGGYFRYKIELKVLLIATNEPQLVALAENI